MRLQTLAVFTLTALVGLAACQKTELSDPQQPAQAQQQPAAAEQTPQPPAPEPQNTGASLIREPAAAPQQAAQAIQTTTFGTTTLHLTKAKVIGQILNVEFVAVPPKNHEGKYDSFDGSSHKLSGFDYIDEATSKRVTLLQDENGRYMADPLNSSGDEVRLSFAVSQPIKISLKFPAPPETSQTITIDFPGVGAFESVPVSR